MSSGTMQFRIGKMTRENAVRHAVVDSVTGCWNWIFFKLNGKYGMKTVNGKRTYAHRLAYQLFVGPIPDGMEVCHRCDNPRCFNPDHLFVGTRQDNVDDCIAKGRFARGAMLPHTKINEGVVIEVRKRCAAGEMQSAIAESLGLSRQHVNDIKQRKIWNHVL